MLESLRSVRLLSIAPFSAPMLALTSLLAFSGCAAEPEGFGEEGSYGEPEMENVDINNAEFGEGEEGLSVGSAIGASCSTSIVRGLSEQLIGELNCLRPGVMSSIAGSNADLGAAVLPYLQGPAASAFRRAASARRLSVNSALRSLAQQYLLYTWYQRGRCGIGLAASPGRSNHEGGLAFDTSDRSAIRSHMSNYAFSWFGNGDPVHYTYQGGSDIRTLSVRAFQRLWNRANPRDRLAEDGAYGSATATRLSRAPSEGFPTGTTCSDDTGATPMPEPEPTPEDPTPTPSPTVAAMGVTWERSTSGSYTFSASSVPDAATQVVFDIDGFRIGTATRNATGSFAVDYRFRYEYEQRGVNVTARNASGQIVGQATGMIDSIAGMAFYIRQVGSAQYEIGLERPSSNVAAIEVRVDGFEVTDSVTGELRSTRRASLGTFTRFGTRVWEVKLFSTSGSVINTLTRRAMIR